LIRTAVGKIFSKYFGEVNFQQVIQWFEVGGELKIPELAATNQRFRQLCQIQGLTEHTSKLGVTNRKDEAASAAAAEMILEGLWAHRRIGRSEERGFYAEKTQRVNEPRERDYPSRPRRSGGGYN